jgi:biotin carboxyl carrier protein
VAHHGVELWLGAGGRTWSLRLEEPWEAGSRGTGGSHGPVLAPMPGTLSKVLVAVGDAVVEGQPVAVIEAMKMELVLRSPAAGVVSEVHLTAPRQVRLNEAILAITAAVDPA